MSLWGVHIGLAVIITTLVAGYLRVSLLNRWMVIFFSGVFATIPDWWWIFTERFIPRLQSPWFAHAYREVFHDSLLANLFWLHGVIDMVGKDDILSSVLVSVSSIAIFLLTEYYLSRESADADRAVAPGD